MTAVQPLPIVNPVPPEGVVSMPPWEWEIVARDYEHNPGNPVLCWRYLSWHPAFWSLEKTNDRGTVITPVGWLRGVQYDMEEDSHGEAVVWMEAAPVLWDADPTDEELTAAVPGYDLSIRVVGVSDPSFNTCLIALAQMVHDRWGNDREFLKIPALEEGKWYG